MSNTRIAQVKDFNAIVDVNGLSKSYLMTTGTGAVYESLRQKGWVIFQSPKMGDEHDFAKWFPNEHGARLELGVRV